MRLRSVVALVAALACASARAEEPPLDGVVVQRLRERLALGRVSEAQAAIAEMTAAPHSRHGLLLYEATLRALRRVAAVDRELPALDAERAAAAAEREANRDSTSTSLQKRLTARLAELDREIAERVAQRQVEGRLEEVARAGYAALLPRLLPDSADELARLLLAKLEQEVDPAADRLVVEMAAPLPTPRVMVPLMSLLRERGTSTELRIALLVGLGLRADPSAAPAVVPALDHADWRVQVESIEALRRFHQPNAIPLLIARLEAASGRVKDDLAMALRSLTGAPFAADAATWRGWWEQDGGATPRPPAPAPRDRAALLASAEAALAAPGGTQFFGIGSFSKRVVFVLDVSGSMNQPALQGTDRTRTKLQVARAHLLQALAALPSDAAFDVVLYAGEVRTCFPQLEPAEDAKRKAATEFIATRLGGGTHVYSALQAAFALADPPGRRHRNAPPAVDTIYFLSDGRPSGGRVVAPDLILREVADWNRAKRIRIHTIGIGADHDRAFLAELAASNGGSYAAR